MHIIEWKKPTNVWISRLCILNVTCCFACDYLQDQQETLGVHLCGLIEYACVYSPADGADHADVYSLHVYIPFHIEGLFVGFKVYYICSAFC